MDPNETLQPTDKQIRYAIYLLGEAGFSTRWMNAEYKKLGASMRERSGRVEDWLRAQTPHEISQLISRLQGEKKGKKE